MEDQQKRRRTKPGFNLRRQVVRELLEFLAVLGALATLVDHLLDIWIKSNSM